MLQNPKLFFYTSWDVTFPETNSSTLPTIGLAVSFREDMKNLHQTCRQTAASAWICLAMLPWKKYPKIFFQLGVSLNGGTPESSIFIGCSIINHPFWGTSIFGNTQMVVKDGDLLWSNPLKIAKIFVENLRVYPTPMPPHPRNEALFGDYYDYEPLLTRNTMRI